MTNTAQPGEIDALVSSVRDLVAQKEPVGRRRRRTRSELLILSQACRVDDEEPSYVPADKGDGPVEVVSNVLRLDAAQQPSRASLEAKIAELEEAVTSQPNDWEPDEGEAFTPDEWAESAFPTPVTDSPEPAVLPTVMPVEPAAAPTETRAEMVAQLAKEVEAAIGITAPPPNPLAEMDVESLRMMVVQIVREELAGELGQKITRNVRKLVRREINRVLASRDMI